MKMSNRCFFFGVLLFAEGVFGVQKYDVTKTVMKGDSVPLELGDTKIPEEDTAQWWFGEKLIAHMNKAANHISTSAGDDAGFKGRLKLDQTGSLTITDIRITDSGIYKLLIKSTTEIYKTYKITVEEIKEMPVKEGDPVSLQLDTEIQSDELIRWMFRMERTCIAEINKTVNTPSLHEDVLGGIFRGRLKLDRQTGSLTITDTRTEHNGLYTVELTSSRGSKYIRFIVTLSSVFGVEKYNVTKTVMKGDSVPLELGDTKIPEDDTAQWWFGKKLIAHMNKAANHISTSAGDDAGFKGRLKLDQTGSLTITDIRITDSGIYKLLIKSTTEIYKTYKITVEDDVKQSVIEGYPVTLYTYFTKIQRDDQIKWKFGDQVILTGHLNSAADSSWSNIQMNDETGDLTIRNIRGDQYGGYEVEIKDRDNSLILHRKFHISVSEKYPDDRNILIGIIVFLLVLVLVGAIVGFVIYKKYKQQNLGPTAGEQNGSANKSGETEVLNSFNLAQ